MKKILKFIAALLVITSCNQEIKEVQKYSIETLMSNNRSSGGYFSKDASKLLYSSDKSGVFNLYEVDLNSLKETQVTNSVEESYFAVAYSPLTNEIIYSADKGGNENSHLYLIRDGESIDLTPGENTKASFLGWTQDEKEMYILSNTRNPKYFDLYKIKMDDLSTKMIMENNEGYSYYPLSNNDKYLVMVKRPSRDIDQMYLLNLEPKLSMK